MNADQQTVNHKQKNLGSKARFRIKLLNTPHPLQYEVVWIDCPAMYADTRFTAQMTSLSAISTTNVTVCSVCLGAATCVQGHVSIVEKFA